MKKIGILTFHNANNYGAVLQAYALKSTLTRLGSTAHVLNYYCPKLQREYKGIPVFKKSFAEIIKYPFKLLFFPILRKQIARRFKSFREQYLLDTKPLLPSIIGDNTQSYDAFVCGSDQVFNPRITHFDSNYFLAFSPNKSKNYSYAASFGLALEYLRPEERAFFAKQLAHFNQISVREMQGAQIVEDILASKAQVHIDPTLLLTKEDWKKLAVLPKTKNYVLLYLMYEDPNLISLAQQLARQKGCELLFISHSMYFRKTVPAPYIKPTPQEWLGLFLNAQYVFTNSFHGLAFSINFNRPFFVGRLPNKRGAINSRFDNLLEITGLQNRLYTRFTATHNFDEPIEWQRVNNILTQEREKSFSYLRTITQG
ncbi:MAG: polysaccharide pyruvyl transferase family protein [Elusimicrobiaceae bacterium]|nr:polysaccharide pyruvyl transferase family protein [Elusimicrobiaceae bacterium]